MTDKLQKCKWKSTHEVKPQRKKFKENNGNGRKCNGKLNNILKYRKANASVETFAEKFEINQKIATMNKDLIKKKESEFMAKMSINKQLSSEIQKIKEKIKINIQKYNRFMVYFKVR